MTSEWDDNNWVIHTRNVSSTYVIGASFVFLAYFLHPAVEKAFLRVRAYRGWRAVENRQTVEVTAYPLVKEVCGGRGSWDAARIVAVLLAAFSLASWGLELQLGIAYRDDLVTDLFLRPPPVWTTTDDNGTTAWHVIDRGDLITEEGTVSNVLGNFFVGTAKARYEINNDPDSILDGEVQIASWDIDVEGLASELSYDDGNRTVHVESYNCSDTEGEVDLYVEKQVERWGTVTDCISGASMDNNTSISPALKINKTGGDTYFIVEESVTYPSFLYSVWKANGTSDNETVRFHVFYISSSARLVEAVVTEIVHASLRDGDSAGPTGGRSFALLRKFSEKYPTYDRIEWEQRASPFGEHPMGEVPNARLSTIETIQKGVTLSLPALLCAVWIMVSTLVGIAWSLLLRSKIGMDIYDRDELIRAVTAPALVNDEEHSSKMRIFVRREDQGYISVAVSDVEGHPNSWSQSFGRNETVAVDDPVPTSSPNHANEFGGAFVPPGSRTVWLEGVRTGRARIYPGRNGNYRYPVSIALVASPVPSRTGSIAGTPVSLMVSPSDAPPPSRALPATGARLFESVSALGESEGHDGDVEMGEARGKGKPEAEPYKDSDSPSLSLSESAKTEVNDLWRLRFSSGSTPILYNSRSTINGISGRTLVSVLGSPARSTQSPTGPEETNNDPYAHGGSEAETEIEHGGV